MISRMSDQANRVYAFIITSLPVLLKFTLHISTNILTELAVIIIPPIITKQADFLNKHNIISLYLTQHIALNTARQHIGEVVYTQVIDLIFSCPKTCRRQNTYFEKNGFECFLKLIHLVCWIKICSETNIEYISNCIFNSLNTS